MCGCMLESTKFKIYTYVYTNMYIYTHIHSYLKTRSLINIYVKKNPLNIYVNFYKHICSNNST